MTKHTRPTRRDLMKVSAAAIAGLAIARSAMADEAVAKPKSPMPTVQSYAQPPLVDDIALSPDGKRVAIISQRGDNKILVHFDVANRTPNILDLGPAKTRGIFWVDNSYVCIEDSVTAALPEFVGSKQEMFQARTVNVDTSEVNVLFGKEEGFYPIVTGNLQRVKIDGQYQVVASSIRMGDEFPDCLYSFAPDRKRGHLVYEGLSTTSRFVVTPEGFVQAYSEYDDSSKKWSLRINQAEPGKSNDFKMVYQVKSDLERPSVAGLGRDGKSIVVYIWSSETEGDYREISPSGVVSEPLDTDDSGKESGALFHPATKRLAGFSRHDDWFSYDYFDPLMKKLAGAIGQVMSDGYRVSISSFAEDPRKMILYGESATDAGSYFYSDFSTGEFHALASNYSDISVEWITQKQAIDYKAADGLSIHAYLTLPPFRAAKNLPLILLPHGGPEARDYISFDWQTQVLASRGYAVLQPNFRGSSGYGDAFVQKGHGEWGRKMQTDLSDGVRWLVSQGIVDPKRVSILGASYGGYAAMAGATIDQGVYNCAVAIAGVSDLPAMLNIEAIQAGSGGLSSTVKYWKRFFGDPSGYADISPAMQAAKAYCPLLLIHGTDDTVVPIDQSRRMEKAMKAAGKPVEFVTYKGQDHWETVGSSRVDMMKAALDFLMRHNPPDAIPA